MFYFTSVLFLNAHDSYSDCLPPLDDFVRSPFMHRGSLAIVVKSSFTTTFLSPVLGFLLFMMDVLVYLLTNGATMALTFVLDLLP